MGKAEQSDAQRPVSPAVAPSVERPAPAWHPHSAHTDSQAPPVPVELADGPSRTVDVQEQQAWQAPIQLQSTSSLGKVAQSESARPLQSEVTAPVVAQGERPHAQSPAEAQTALPLGGTAYGQPEAPSSPVLPSQPSHADHALYQQIRDGVEALDARHGRSFDATSERMAASLLVLAKDNDLDRVDHVLLSNATPDKAAGHSLFVVQGEPSDPAHQRAAMPTALAAQTSVEDSMQQFDAVTREAQQRAQANQLEQQLDDQRVQQSVQSRAASMG
ncbi:XVIPCD domain-containing protein [Stenotrophomonas sp. CFBP 13718]|uniref:XVIPCD domain-containing protein n=1 Tax=Stenotrophomonas sp. CFBP 13718 TaxID=2775304 RepID=UPI003139204C